MAQRKMKFEQAAKELVNRTLTGIQGVSELRATQGFTPEFGRRVIDLFSSELAMLESRFSEDDPAFDPEADELMALFVQNELKALFV
jgi:hypothetical protein